MREWEKKEEKKRFFNELKVIFFYSFDLETLCDLENRAKLQKTSSFSVVLCYIHTVIINFDKSDLYRGRNVKNYLTFFSRSEFLKSAKC